MIEPISYLTLPEFDVEIPDSLEEALNLLKLHQANCKILAGGTDLLIELRHRLIRPKLLIDVKNIPELTQLDITDEGLVIGAAVPIAKILKFIKKNQQYKSLIQALNEMCDEILRERATIGGNISTASPAADSAGPLLVYQALIEVHSKSKGKRIIPIRNFFTGVKANCLKPDELVTNITLPLQTEDTISFFKKMKRSTEDLAIVGVTGLYSKKNIFLAYTAVAPTPILIEISDYFTSTREMNEEKFQLIWQEVKSQINPITDLRSDKEYRFHITEILTRQILKEVIK